MLASHDHLSFAGRTKKEVALPQTGREVEEIG
jgi:hypothetical protein